LKKRKEKGGLKLPKRVLFPEPLELPKKGIVNRSKITSLVNLEYKKSMPNKGIR